VHATLQGLIDAVNQGVARGKITSAQGASLVTQLQSATGSSAKSKLTKLISQVQSQSGVSIDAGYAALLVNWANDLITRL